MDIEKILNLLLKPIYLRVFIIFVAMVVLFRNGIYLLLGDLPYVFSGQQRQDVIHSIFKKEIPALVMTVLWPIVFTALNLIHESVKISKNIFVAVLFVHVTTCIIAALLLLDGGCGQGCEPSTFYTTVIGGATLTILAVMVSVWLYKHPTLFSKHAGSGRQ